MAKKIGLAANLYCLTTGTRATWSASATNNIYSGPAPTGLVKVAGAKDLGIDLEKGEVDGTDRDNLGWEAVIGALRKGGISFKMNRDPSDPAQQALFKSFLGSGTYVPVCLLSDDKAMAGAEGIWMDAEVLGWKVGQAMNGMYEVDVSLKPSALSAVPPQWVTVAAS